MGDYDQPLGELLDELRDADTPLRAALVYRLSEPSPADLEAVQAAWGEVPVERRRLLVSRLVQASEMNFELDFVTFAEFALTDEDEEVRTAAVEALWTSDEIATMRRLVALLLGDASATVRAAAAQALGRFVLAGELDEVPSDAVVDAEAALIETWLELSEPTEVRRRALESIAYSGREEVTSFIEEALADVDTKMRASAVFAMGRSADEQWEHSVRDALNDVEPEIRFEAARAAGELVLVHAVPQLIELLGESDDEIRQASIWALGEIGGRAAQNALLQLAESETDEALLEYIEDALNMAALGEGDFATYLLESDDTADDADADDAEGPEALDDPFFDLD